MYIEFGTQQDVMYSEYPSIMKHNRNENLGLYIVYL